MTKRSTHTRVSVFIVLLYSALFSQFVDKRGVRPSTRSYFSGPQNVDITSKIKIGVIEQHTCKGEGNPLKHRGAIYSIVAIVMIFWGVKGSQFVCTLLLSLFDIISYRIFEYRGPTAGAHYMDSRISHRMDTHSWNRKTGALITPYAVPEAARDRDHLRMPRDCSARAPSVLGFAILRLRKKDHAAGAWRNAIYDENSSRSSAGTYCSPPEAAQSAPGPKRESEDRTGVVANSVKVRNRYIYVAG